MRPVRNCLLALVALCAATGAHAQIVNVAASNAATTGGGATSVSVATPAGTAANDVMLAVAAVRGPTQTINVPAGWTAVAAQASVGDYSQRVFWRVAVAAEPATHTFSWSASDRGVAAIVTYRGVDTTAPLDASAGQATPASSTITAPSITTTLANTVLVGFFGIAHGAAGFTLPSPAMTNVFGAGSEPGSPGGPNGVRVLVSEEPMASAGATGARLVTASQTADVAGRMVALRPLPLVSHYAISVLTATVANCDFAEVTITAHDAGHIAVNAPLGRIVTLSVSAGAATAAWQPPLVSGSGTWTPSGATATYAWSGTESSFTVRLAQGAVISLTVNANDTFATEDATEDPTISFADSAFRISNGANAALAIGNQIAAKPSDTGAGAQALFLQAVSSAAPGVCSAAFPAASEIDIEVGAQCNNPATCAQNVTLTTTAGSGSPSGSFVPAGAGSYPTTIRFRFSTANAEAPFYFSYADAGQITLQFRHIAVSPPSTITGTSNPFVTRPFGFAFRGANDTTAIQHGTLPTDALLAAAGENFTMTLAAYRWVGAEDAGTGDPLPGADITDNGLTPNFASSTLVSATGNLPGIATGAVSRGAGCAGAATIAAGSWSGGAATLGDWCYNEAGNAFFNATASDYLAAGVNVRGDSGLDGTGAAGGYVGRFKPKFFVVTGVPTLANRVALACAPASSFTYMNEGLQLGFTLQARNAQNVLTQNYSGAYAKLDLTAAASLGIGAISGATNLTPRVDNALAPGGSFTNGIANLSATTAIRRAAPDTPDGPYAATRFGIAPNDDDPNPASGVQMQSFDLDVDGVGGNDHAAIAPPTELRYGRLRLQNAYGAVSQPLPMPIAVQHWNGSAFVTNALDDCTTLARANIALSFAGAVSACDTAVTQASIAFASGAATLTLAAPGAGNSGTVLLAPQLGSAAGTYCPAVGGAPAAASASPAIYLLGRWDDAADPDADANTSYDDKPSGQAGFGLYGSQPKNFIFFRENY